jgi:hypothetical protein
LFGPDTDDSENDGTDADSYIGLIRTAPLYGPNFAIDNVRVYRILVTCLNQDAQPWIKPFTKTLDGHGAMMALRDIYAGPGTVLKRMAEANSQLNAILWRGEGSFTFESYISKLQAAFTSLAECGEPKTERSKIELLCDHMHTTDTKLICAMQNLRMNQTTMRSFQEFANLLSEQVSIRYPAVAGRQGPALRQAAALDSRGRGGRGGVRGAAGRGTAGRGGGRGAAGRGRGGRGRGGSRDPSHVPVGGDGNHNYDVHTMNLDQTLHPSEWKKLTGEEMLVVFRRRDEARRRGVSTAQVASVHFAPVSPPPAVPPPPISHEHALHAGNAFGPASYAHPTKKPRHDNANPDG